jgi:hypothetical protein
VIAAGRLAAPPVVSRPHLSAEQKAELWGSIPPYQRDARSKGIPQLGSGAIYPVPESEIVVDPFEIPLHWPRGYGLDVGWNRTAAIWGAPSRRRAKRFASWSRGSRRIFFRSTTRSTRRSGREERSAPRAGPTAP